jgi:hypothetical protein
MDTPHVSIMQHPAHPSSFQHCCSIDWAVFLAGQNDSYLRARRQERRPQHRSCMPLKRADARTALGERPHLDALVPWRASVERASVERGQPDSQGKDITLRKSEEQAYTQEPNIAVQQLPPTSVVICVRSTLRQAGACLNPRPKPSRRAHRRR